MRLNLKHNLLHFVNYILFKISASAFSRKYSKGFVNLSPDILLKYIL